MSQALTDLLIDVADPAKLQLYRNEPEAFMDKAGLSEEEKDALRSGISSRIRLQAMSISAAEESQSEYRQFTSARTLTFNPALVEIDPTVHVDLQTNENVAAAGPGQLFIDGEGKLFRGCALDE